MRRTSGRHQPSFCARAISSAARIVASASPRRPRLGEGVRQDTEVVGHPRQVIDVAELLDGSLERVDRVGRRVALRAGQGSTIEHGDRTPGDEAVPPHVLVEHRDVAITLVVAPAPIENRAGVREDVVQREVMLGLRAHARPRRPPCASQCRENPSATGPATARFPTGRWGRTGIARRTSPKYRRSRC